MGAGIFPGRGGISKFLAGGGETHRENPDMNDLLHVVLVFLLLTFLVLFHTFF